MKLTPLLAIICFSATAATVLHSPRDTQREYAKVVVPVLHPAVDRAPPPAWSRTNQMVFLMPQPLRVMFTVPVWTTLPAYPWPPDRRPLVGVPLYESEIYAGQRFVVVNTTNMTAMENPQVIPASPWTELCVTSIPFDFEWLPGVSTDYLGQVKITFYGQPGVIYSVQRQIRGGFHWDAMSDCQPTANGFVTYQDNMSKLEGPCFWRVRRN